MCRAGRPDSSNGAGLKSAHLNLFIIIAQLSKKPDRELTPVNALLQMERLLISHTTNGPADCIVGQGSCMVEIDIQCRRRTLET